MAKILLVEDDNNLREIYEARLSAEGYEIVAARDGEEALSVAIKELPDLIISDVMMPKISGFDMLDIIRTTEETKNVKVIMMTALSQAEDKARADKLGADRYLVKSQVTLEDVAKVAKEVLSETPRGDAAAATTTATTTLQVDSPATPIVATPTPATSPDPATPTPTALATAAISTPTPLNEPTNVAVPAPATPVVPEPVTDDATTNVAAEVASFVESRNPAPEAAPTATTDSNATTEQAPVPVAVPTPAAATETATTADALQPVKKKIIQPLNDLNGPPAVDLQELLKKEETKDQMAQIVKDISQTTVTPSAPTPLPTPAPVVQEAPAAPGEIRITEDGQIVSDSLTNSTSSTPTMLTAPVPAATPVTTSAAAPQVVAPSAPVAPAAATPEPTDTPAPQVTITPAYPGIDTAQPAAPQATPAAPQVVAPSARVAPAAPAPQVIPHENGTSIDGIVAQPTVLPVQPAPPLENDPSSISL